MSGTADVDKKRARKKQIRRRMVRAYILLRQIQRTLATVRKWQEELNHIEVEIAELEKEQ